MANLPVDEMELNEAAANAQDEALLARMGGVREETLATGRGLESVMRIPVLLQVVLGSASMPVSNLLKLGRGAIVPLDHRVGEPVDVVVNGRIIARGEVMVVEDDNSRFGVSLTEIVGPSGPETA
ncbi:MAG: flagellar motor switch protein FliN [Rhizobiales bacterium 24-66-13]|jgi:flagellar motor switch protein FliN/FliY|nr:MAG: flagellar motor switch protein FliN [Azorhizobium sp. 12-66-6]OYY26109.1 MAG: flagellar motor switch protein FliN [Azorhizobium sp. 35-67-15]OYY81767.1 MAG: flagellar motor switch protein FliN [Rhizobiales bacterium 35-66-30]OYZ65003.1 MAG: flagellar motor switch protein FliN [Rhizobiales bacterium 24-66-13]OZB00431.1 MAG: flagellar motor switch protein FliN [Rhizobiales bacterium 39-66-18]